MMRTDEEGPQVSAHLVSAARVIRNLSKRAFEDANIRRIKAPGRGRYELRGASGRLVRIQIDSSDGNVVQWRVTLLTRGELPGAKDGVIRTARDVYAFEWTLEQAIERLKPRREPRIIAPKGQWAVKVAGVILLLFAFASVKTFSVISSEVSGNPFRGNLADGVVEWRRVMSSIGPGGFGEVFLGSVIFHPVAALSCVGLGALAIFYWTTPIRQSLSDLVTLWGIFLLLVPVACVGVAMALLPWQSWGVLLVGLAVFGSPLFMRTSVIELVPRWGETARKFDVSQSRRGNEVWPVFTGAWEPREISTTNVARHVRLHAERCEAYATRSGSGDDSAIKYSLMIVEMGGELLGAVQRSPDLSQPDTWKRAESRVSRRSFVAKVRVFLSGTALLLAATMCAVWLATDSTPWVPPVCLQGEKPVEGYVLGDNPVLFVDEETRTPELLEGDEVSFDFEDAKCE